MNKKRVEEYLPTAIEALKECGIAKKGKIVETFRSQISSFGAAVSMGSFKAAVAFFSKKAKSSQDKDDVDRSKLIEAMWYVTHNKEKKAAQEICDTILKYGSVKSESCKSQFIDASIALKLAMNAYELIKKKEKEE